MSVRAVAIVILLALLCAFLGMFIYLVVAESREDTWKQ